MIRPLSSRQSLIMPVVIGILGCVSIGADSGQAPVAPEEYRQKLRQMEQSRLTDAERLLLAQYTTQQLQSTANNAQRLLASLQQKAHAFEQLKATLLDSDQGKRIAADGLALVAYSDLDMHPAVSLTEIKAKADAASGLANILKQPATAPEVGHTPSAATQDKINDLYFWAQDRLLRLDAQQSLLNSILRDAPSDLDVAKRPTLRVVLERYRSRWQRILTESGILGENLATEQAQQTVVNASYLATLEKANANAERIRTDMQTEIAKLKADTEVALLKKQAETETLLAEAQERYKDAQAEIARLREEAALNREIKVKTDEMERQGKRDELRRKQLIEEAKSSRVQSVCAPFITPGYWQPASSKPAYDRGPVSLSQLRRKKALEPTPDGLSALLRIGIDKSDKERPRWGWSMYLAKLSPTQLDELKEVQQDLIKLGDVMVELGMLAP